MGSINEGREILQNAVVMASLSGRLKTSSSTLRVSHLSGIKASAWFSVYIGTLKNLVVYGTPLTMLNPLKPNDPYRGRTAPLTSKRCILYIYSTNIGTEYFKHGLYSPFFLFKMQFVS